MSIETQAISLRSHPQADDPWDFPTSPSPLRLADVAPPVDLEILVPALNEEDRLGGTLQALTQYLTDRQLEAAVTVIDNGSSDRTVDVVASFAASRIPVSVLGCARRGKGAAVRKAVLQSNARWVGFCDADLSTPVDTLDTVLSFLRDGHDIVVASRRCPGALYAVKQPVLRRLGSYGFRRLTAAYAPTVSDTQCGFKFFSRDAARDIFDRALIDGFAFDIEVLGLAHGSGKAIVEVPVVWRDIAGSSFRPWKDGRRVARDVIELRRRFARELSGETIK